MEFEGLTSEEEKKKLCPGCGEPLNDENKCINIHCEFFDTVFSEEEKKEESKPLEKRGSQEMEYLFRHAMGLETGEVVEPQKIEPVIKKQPEETQEKKETDRLKRIKSAIEFINKEFKFNLEKWFHITEQEKDIPEFKEDLGKIFDKAMADNNIFENKDKIEVLKKIEVDTSYAQIQIIFEDFKEEKLKKLK